MRTAEKRAVNILKNLHIFINEKYEFTAIQLKLRINIGMDEAFSPRFNFSNRLLIQKLDTK